MFESSEKPRFANSTLQEIFQHVGNIFIFGNAVVYNFFIALLVLFRQSANEIYQGVLVNFGFGMAKNFILRARHPIPPTFYRNSD